MISGAQANSTVVIVIQGRETGEEKTTLVPQGSLYTNLHNKQLLF